MKFCDRDRILIYLTEQYHLRSERTIDVGRRIATLLSFDNSSTSFAVD